MLSNIFALSLNSGFAWCVQKYDIKRMHIEKSISSDSKKAYMCKSKVSNQLLELEIGSQIGMSTNWTFTIA